ncbi:MAG: AAA family ATPase [Oceanospirillaceae bacterium]|nr:AAA family ATPase [Oceanospirillaceae bacterium]
MTRSIGWVQHFDKDGIPSGTSFEINFPYKPNDRELKEIDVYHQIADAFPQLEKTRPTRYQWDNPTSNGLSGLRDFISNFLPKINEIIQESELDTLEIPSNTMLSSIERTNAQIEGGENQDLHWQELKEAIHRIDNPQDIKLFFRRLKEVLEENNLKEEDSRIYFSCRNNSLIQATFGPHYGVWIEIKQAERIFGFVIGRSTTGNAQGKKYAKVNSGEEQTIDSLFASSKEVISQTLSQYDSSPHRSKYSKKFNPWIYRAAMDPSLLDKLLSSKSTSEPKSTSMDSKRESATNRIYFGPPGTGKTYELSDTLFSKYTTKSESVTEADFLEAEASELSWWQACALGLLETGPTSVVSLMENRWVKNKIERSSSKNVRAAIWSSLQTHTFEDDENVKYANRVAPLLFNKSDDSIWSVNAEALNELVPELVELKQRVDDFSPKEGNEIKRYTFATFHQSFTYEDFVEGIKPKLNEAQSESEGSVQYLIEPGVFKKICESASKNPHQRYAIFIDEINRGNVAAIFGELITLIEADKREGEENEISVTLPYSKQKFSVPSNLDIYGTMNTADRSVEALDSALRRRFEFVEVGPKPEKLDEVEGISMRRMLEVMNARLTWLKDKDHTIGHAYFMKVMSPEDLRLVFKNKVVPLLEEYFFNAPEEIVAVLGKGFSAEIKNPWSNGDTPDGYDGEKIRIRVPEKTDEFISALKEGILGETE